jgi:protein-tyrosine phosphatase
VEFNDFSIPPNTEETLHHLQLLGIAPIITHPERNHLIRKQPERLQRWLHQGCYVQITAMSVTGKFGESAKKMAEDWLEKDMVHFFASDAHNTDKRPLRLREAFQIVADRRGDDVAAALFQDNPLAAFEGRPLPYAPEQPEVGPSKGPTRRKRFGFF